MSVKVSTLIIIPNNSAIIIDVGTAITVGQKGVQY